jgi:hypothetical protein
VGDQNQWITVYGSGLFNSDGSPPTLVVEGASTLSVYPQGGNPGGQGSTSSQLFATYSISSGTQYGMAPIIDVITDAGTSNDTNFNIGDAPATITSLVPVDMGGRDKLYPHYHRHRFWHLSDRFDYRSQQRSQHR